MKSFPDFPPNPAMGDPSAGPTPPGWKLVLVKWLGVYPPLVALVYGIDWVTKRFASTDWPLMTDAGTLHIWAKLLCTTAILVTAMHYAITPMMDSLFERWLYTREERERMHDDPEVDR